MLFQTEGLNLDLYTA